MVPRPLKRDGKSLGATPRSDLIAASVYDKYFTATKFTTHMDHASNYESVCVVNFVTEEYLPQILVRVRFLGSPRDNPKGCREHF